MALTRHHKLCYLSSPDRGLEILLEMWPHIRAAFPQAQLEVAYGWAVFDMLFHNNPERQAWKQTILEKLKQPGITDHGRIGKAELQTLRRQCGIWAYPTWFAEINCITALECQADGCVPVTVNSFALKETVGSGIKIEGDIYEAAVQEQYLHELLALMGDEKRWKREQDKGIQFARDYAWSTIAAEWERAFTRRDETVKVTLYTPTIRTGFWRTMAKNISEQSYKNIEWLIVDDYAHDRHELAQKTASEWGITIRYVRGKARNVKRSYALVNANNTALAEAQGDILVFLQDFVYMPLDGVEQIVKLHRDHPEALLAFPDMYVAPKVTPDIESEDWFHGEDDIFGPFIRQNVRIQNKGLRNTDNPYDFEQNYGAIPVKVAKALGGWWEFYDEGLGYDNTDIAFRALESGYQIILDELNIAVCVDHWAPLQGTKDLGLGRARKLNDPRYIFMTEMIKAGKLPLVRTQALDDSIKLLYDIPESISDDEVVKWLNTHSAEIVNNWLIQYENISHRA